MLPRLAACLLAALLAVPGATAFSASRDEVTIRYDQGAPPLVLAVGQLAVSGALRDGLLLGAILDGRAERIPTLSIAEMRNGTPSVTNVSDATLVLHAGNLAWRMEDASAVVRANASYGVGLALPTSPFDESADPGPGIVLAGPRLEVELAWLRGDVQLLPLSATLSVLDAGGSPLAGWDRRVANPAADLRSLDANGTGDAVVLTASGAFRAHVEAQALAAGLGARDAQLRVDVRTAAEDRFEETARAVTETTTMFAGDDAAAGPGFEQLGALSGFFNGAVLLLEPPGEEEDAEPARPLEARLGERPLEMGPFTLLRSEDLALAWGDGTLAVVGGSALSVTQNGFAVDPPLTLGPIPLVSALLWLAAAGAVALFFLRRPPASKGKWSLRGIGWGVYAVTLVLVFWWWDASFADTFGTSLLTLLRQDGVAAANYTQLALVFGIQMIPWSLSVLLFALPARIALGVALRYKGEGSSFKGVAKAGGLVALGLLGPVYALWIVNVLVQRLVAAAPQLFG